MQNWGGRPGDAMITEARYWVFSCKILISVSVKVFLVEALEEAVLTFGLVFVKLWLCSVMNIWYDLPKSRSDTACRTCHLSSVR